ncbi:FadR/GntR family transcriptional regulator [Marispirochaeta sp.]|uniref:FadR/GntR family transcriptional regulator n=1 Tax=Marispirochaeta sp. TaxID=2038653 RepID=UPI0029C641BF|nr:FadR/GntR family transcriptional regulator [Marispirochaeta sp.]
MMSNKQDNLFGKLNKKKVFEEVAEMIRSLIDAGTLNPGDQLPPERELAEQLGVSRTSVREAIRALELMGEVETRVGVSGGTFIREVSLTHALNVVQTLFRRTNQMVSDIIEVRLILETKSAALAAERRTEDDLKEIYKAIDDMEKDLGSGSIGISSDHAYHLAIARASENDFLFGLSQLVEDLIEQTRELTLSRGGVPEEALKDHRTLADAIRDGKADLAETLMREHLIKAYNISTTG